MNASAALNMLRELGVAVRLIGADIELTGASKLPVSMVAELRELKPAILDELRQAEASQSELLNSLNYSSPSVKIDFSSESLACEGGQNNSDNSGTQSPSFSSLAREGQGEAAMLAPTPLVADDDPGVGVEKLLEQMRAGNEASFGWWARPPEGWPDSLVLRDLNGNTTVVWLRGSSRSH